MTGLQRPVTKYDVFLNHRGPDTRNNFVAHLEAALIQQGFHPLLDTKALVVGKGEHAFDSIAAALQSVCVHVAVFSKGYAESEWCLNELHDMLETQRAGLSVIIPVFYGVEPQNLRKPEIGPFAAAFEKHYRKGKHDDVERWKKALCEAADITGFGLWDVAGDENKLKENVVHQVHRNFAGHDVQPNCVGQLEEFVKLFTGSHDLMRGGVQVLGIVGMGGIGKTTRAKEIFNHYASEHTFGKQTFLSDVRGSKMLDLQIKQVHDLLQVMVENVDEFRYWFERIKGREVLIVIDDIDDVDQFEALVPDLNQLPQGSLIIVTSRKGDVLKRIMGEKNIYELKELELLEARKLFNFHAFSGERVRVDLQLLAEEIADACKGLPLALEIVGCYLKNETEKKIWEETLCQINGVDILDKLVISCEGLTNDDKLMFLDISCHMIGLPVGKAMQIWESYNPRRLSPKGPKASLSTLKGRRLITVDELGQLRVHDLLRDMGRNMAVKRSKPDKLGKRSHLCDLPDSEWVVREMEPQGLRVYNTLRREKVLFITKDGSRNVSWYICGPTVYDSSHVGHARNYVTFDILRRILEDYFGYNVNYVMNVTDVDDKIINRARRNYLLDQYRNSATDLNKVLEDLDVAFKEEISKQEEKITMAFKERDKTTSSRQKEELMNKINQEALKLDNVKKAMDLMEHQKAEALKLGDKEGVEMILTGGAADTLASQLDAKHGASVTDHAIYKAHTAKYESEFWNDMTSLGVRFPRMIVRVTEYMDKIIEYVEVILKHNFAYVANGSVYFDTKAFKDAGHEYGKLNPWAVGSSELASESESNFLTTEKKSSCDFALWKKSKQGEPEWKSPWGMGRPGWHIECSAMASDILGDCMDIHSGGHDLQFPHHDNELAQAEAYFHNHEWVRYFFHSGHLSIDGLKMSKSLKNFITIKEALQKNTARQLRMLFVIQSWDKSINFSSAAVNEAVGKEKQFKNFFSNIEVQLRESTVECEQRLQDEEKEINFSLGRTQLQVRERLEDNFDTAGALTAILLLVKDVHSYIDKCKSKCVKPRQLLLREAALFVTRILSIFGLSDAGKEEIGFGSSTGQAGSNISFQSVVSPYLDAFSAFRDQIRAAAKEGTSNERILELTDKVRDETMLDLGVRLEDDGATSTWRLDNPEVMRRERNEKWQNVREEKLRVLKQNRDKKATLLEKRDAASISARVTFEKKMEYSAFDERGVPTKDAEGKELTKSAKKKVELAFKKAEKEHEIFNQNMALDPHYLHNLRLEVQSLTSQISELEQTRLASDDMDVD